MPYFVQYHVVGNVGCHFVLNLLILCYCVFHKKILVSWEIFFFFSWYILMFVPSFKQRFNLTTEPNVSNVIAYVHADVFMLCCFFYIYIYILCILLFLCPLLANRPPLFKTVAHVLQVKIKKQSKFCIVIPFEHILLIWCTLFAY